VSSKQYPPSTSPSRLRSRHLIKISACPAEFRWKFLHASGGQLKSCSVNTHCFKKVPRSWGISCEILSRKAFEMISICGTGTLQMGIRIRDLAKEIAITSSDIDECARSKFTPHNKGSVMVRPPI